MPHSEIHKKKLRKNLAILALIFFWCLIIWFVTMIRVARADDIGTEWRGRNYTGIGIPSKPVDTRGPFYDDRVEQREKNHDTKQEWDNDYHGKGDSRLEAEQARDEQRDNRLQATVETADQWDKDYHEKSIERAEALQKRDADRTAHRDAVAEKPQGWWNGWLERQEEKQ